MLGASPRCGKVVEHVRIGAVEEERHHVAGTARASDHLTDDPTVLAGHRTDGPRPGGDGQPSNSRMVGATSTRRQDRVDHARASARRRRPR